MYNHVSNDILKFVKTILILLKQKDIKNDINCNFWISNFEFLLFQERIVFCAYMFP